MLGRIFRDLVRMCKLAVHPMNFRAREERGITARNCDDVCTANDREAGDGHAT